MSDLDLSTAGIVYLAAGASFVLLDGWKRFDDPVRADSLATYRALHLDSRSSTTALSYFGALGLYLASLMMAYALLVMNHAWLKTITENTIFANLLEGLGLPMLAALALIVVVPQLKPFSMLENFVRSRLQSWASIPVEVSRFAHDLKDYEYIEPGRLKAASLEIDGVPGSDDSSGYAVSLQRHLQAKTLLDSLEAWRSSRIFGGYFASFSGVHQQLQTEARKLTRQVEVYQEAVLALGIESKTARSQGEGLKESANELLRGVCYFIAAGILRCCPLESARNRELTRLGFVPGSRQEPILPGQVALLLLAVTSLLVASTFVMSAVLQREVLPGEALLRSVRIASLYVSATLTAVYLWQRFGRPAGERLRDRPYHQYLCAAGLAVGICLILRLAFSLGEIVRDFQATLGDLYNKLPYHLLTAAVAFGIAFLLDNPRPPGLSVKKQRLLEGAALGLLLGLLAVLVHALLNANAPGSAPPLPSLMLTGSTVGFLLGWCMPTWCRDNQRALATEKKLEALAAATASPQLAS